MTVETTISKVVANGNGSATAFSFSPVVITTDTDLQVYMLDNLGNQTLLTEGTGPTQYVVVPVGTYPCTGSISYPGVGGVTLPTGWSLTMNRVLLIQQTTALDNQGGYFADVQEAAFDRLTMVALQLQEQLDRAAVVPITSSISPTTLIANLVELAVETAPIATVADNIASVVLLAENVASLPSLMDVAAALTAVENISTNLSAVNAVASDLTTINTVAGDLTAINAATTYATNSATSATAAAASATAAAASAVTAAGYANGSFTGPGSSTLDHIVTFADTTGALGKDSGVLMASVALLASPTFTGTPAAPTASTGTNTTQLSTTAFVNASVAAFAAAPAALGSTTPAAVSATTLSASSTVSGAGITALFASPPAIGGTAAAAATHTTVNATTSVTIGAGSAITSSGPGGVLGSGAFASAYSLPAASTTVVGGVKIDGTSITIASGVISAGGAPTYGSVNTYAMQESTPGTWTVGSSYSLGGLSGTWKCIGSGHGCSATAVCCGNAFTNYQIAFFTRTS